MAKHSPKTHSPTKPSPKSSAKKDQISPKSQSTAKINSSNWVGFTKVAAVIAFVGVVVQIYNLHFVREWIDGARGGKGKVEDNVMRSGHGDELVGSGNYTTGNFLEPFVEKVQYDLNGYVVGRKLPEVEIMPADRATEYEVEDPTKLSPYVKFLPGPPMSERRERAMGARFRNFYDFDLTKWWDDGTETGVYNGVLRARGDTATNTYTTHVFIFRNKMTNEEVARIEMVDDRHLYFIGPDPADTAVLNSDRYKDSLKEVAFMEKYYAENGIPWLSYYPREPPKLYIWPADFVGQTHGVKSHYGYFASPIKESEEPLTINVTVVSTRPRVFLIEKLFSPFEVQHIISLGEKVVRQSMVGSDDGGFKSNTRTSENGWLQRSQSKVLNTIYYRIGDVLRMTDYQLQDNGKGSAENLQFVRYLHNQRYDAHHDFGHTGRVEQRFSTLLIYLEVPAEGGATSFPKAFNGQGIEVKPSPGDAVLFYSMTPDGNGDDMSLHAGMPVTSGRKYVCNLWSWDPKRYF